MNPHNSKAAAQDAFAQGFALHRAGRSQEAAGLYQQALLDDPDHFDALHLLGTIRARSGEAEQGADLIARAIQINPNVGAAHFALGAVLNELKRHQEALASFDQALALSPELVQARYNRGLALAALNQPEEALAAYDAAIATKPDYARAHANRAALLHRLGRRDEALAAYDHAIVLDPASAEALFNRAVLLQEMQRRHEAIAGFDAVISLAPEDVESRNRRGILLGELGRTDEALAAYEAAIAVAPNQAEAHYNRGTLLHELGSIDAATLSFDAAVKLKPDYAEARLNRALSHLLAGNLDAGWRDYEWRKSTWSAAARVFDERQLWLGAPDPRGKRLFVHHEQGIGDTLQFCRYIKPLRDTGAELTLSAHASLKPLLAQLDPALVIVGDDEQTPDFDYFCPLLSLPLVFGTTLDTIPSEPSYLHADPERRARFEALLGERRRPRVGLVWSGEPSHRNDHNRSIPFERLTPLLGEDADFVCLQDRIRPSDEAAVRASGRVAFHGEALADFSDTAGLTDLMDLVITVDTSLAHLAGAMGKPVFVLLPFTPDWRWLLGRDDSPWYPSARLFRQPRIGDWPTVIEAVRQALRVALT